ncbi:Rho termination factor N-terminal domain-containing protein [Acetivibrio straminisolvens]|uniref:Transcription termination factor Rho n=1 Tax=Acetivibrio straminisolvens JCM 21531 TaxID=1294263 RepID=W4V946_9FIRM|nr:transcription termination factor Rho [Acetivibrio straminisolvens JCM 21531]
MEDIKLTDKTLEDLRYIAKMLGIKRVTTYKKSELIEKIYEVGKSNGIDNLQEQIANKDEKENPAENKDEQKNVKSEEQVSKEPEIPKAEELLWY